MTDNCDKSVISLAITEKRPNRPGGCIGIFFQLFDWNRRFAKKKLFSRKLLPPVRPKHAPKKFAGDEKFPKLRLLAGENGDDFPNLRKNGSHNIDSQSRPGMQSPSLVARLMGLESIPAAEKEKSPNEKLSLEKTSSKNELRPQKIQKTEVYEREPVSRLGLDSMPLKNMLSRSRRHRPKLVSPVKSPRMPPGRNGSRLIDVAAKILEPGLHSRNRAKGALTYTSSRIHNLPSSMEGNAYSPRSTSIDDLMMEGRQQVFNVLEVPDHDGVVAKPMKVHSCKNCGDKFDAFASSSSLLKHPSVYDSPISQFVEPSTVILEKDKKPFEQRNRQEMGNVFVQTHNEADQSYWPFSSQSSSRQSDIQSSTAFKQKTIRQNKIPMGRDKVHQSSKLSNLQSSGVNDVNVDNKSPTSSRSRSRMPVKPDSDALDTGRKTYTKPDDSTSPVRKRRSVNSTIVKQRTGKCETASSKETRQGSFSSTSQNTTRRRLVNSAESSRTTNSNKEKDIVSYSYNSPLKHKPGAHKDMEYKRRYLNGSVDGNPSSNTIGESSSHEEDSCQLSGDALGALLEQKLKELTSQMDDELEEAGGTPKRTTAMILQELITALNAERPTQNVLVDGSDQKKVSSGARVLTTKFSFQVEERAKGASAGYSHDSDHYSPGSVLEASFSNDSCLSSSLDDGSVPGHDHLPPLEAEVDLVDSSYSFLSKGSSRFDRISDILGHISEALCCINIRDSFLKENKSDHAKEVILNAEMVFQNFDGSKEFSLAGYLIEELESLASAMPAMEDIKDGYQLKGFLFDCIVEYLDSRYGPCWKTGFRAWRRTSPSRITGDILTSGVVEEVKRWTKFAGWNADEIIEWEMSHCLGKWTDFEIEGFEIGVEIEEELLDNLVNEVVADFIM